MKNINSSNSPLVTIAIPVFRGEQYIQSAIDSVLSQSLNNFELLVVDNNSDDKTVEIVLSYSDPRIILIRNEKNIGVEANWNKCLALARGIYIKILPHDDTLEPDCLKEQVKVFDMDSEGQIGLVFCARAIINDVGELITKRHNRSLIKGRIKAKKLIRLCTRKGTNLIGEPGAVLFRLRDSRTVGNFNEKIPYVIDLDYWLRLLAHGDAYYIDKYLSNFRISKGSWSVGIGSSQAKEFTRFIDLIAQNPANSISNFDRVLGRLTAIINGIARRIFYKLFIQ